MGGKGKHIRTDPCRQSYYRRLAAPKLFKGERVVQGEEVNLVFRDDGGRAPSTARQLSDTESRAFILNALGHDSSTPK